MREFIDARVRVTWTMPLTAMREFINMFSGAWMGSSPSGLTRTNAPQQTNPAFQAGNQPQSGLVSPASAVPIQNAPLPNFFRNAAPVNRGSLDTSRMVVLGEGLAAGVGDFALHAEAQNFSFPAQMARQMSADLPQRLIQPPGIGNFVGFAPLPVRVPAPMQSTVLEQLPPQPVSNLSVPEFTLEDALSLRPR